VAVPIVELWVVLHLLKGLVRVSVQHRRCSFSLKA
jgi:hypothetical protein